MTSKSATPLPTLKRSMKLLGIVSEFLRGLGEATLYHDGACYQALPSEGGHADFAPTTDEEIDLLRFLRGKYGDHVSNERILSGNGIADLYAFLHGTTTWPGDPNAAIAEKSRISSGKA